MKRISTDTKVVDKFGAGKPGFTNGNALTGVPATDLEADLFDHIQEELCAIPEAAGIAVDGSSRSQVLSALSLMFGGLVSSSRNTVMKLAAASASANFTADLVVVKTGMLGTPFLLNGFNQTINLATVGAGGMDVGAAPAGGFVAIYAIRHGTTGAQALLGVNATAARAPELYGGANMPVGYTASALMAVCPTNASGQLKACSVRERRVSFASTQVLSATSGYATFTAVPLGVAVPLNAMRCTFEFNMQGAANVNQVHNLAQDANGTGLATIACNAAASSLGIIGQAEFDIATAQTVYFKFSGSSSAALSIREYWF